MDPIRKRELKRQAFMRLAAQRRRAGLLRGRVVILSLLCFVILWGAVFVQMATGNDPVLSAKEKAVTRAASSARREIKTTDPRELEPTRATAGEEAAREESSEAASAAETGSAGTEAAEEAESAEIESAEEAAPVEAEAEEAEVVEEPLVTSQS